MSEKKFPPPQDLIDVQTIDPDLDEDIVQLAGLLVVAKPDKLASVEQEITQLPGVEVHLTDEKGQMVVTIEEPPGEKTLSAIVAQINHTSGVISTALVYAHQD